MTTITRQNFDLHLHSYWSYDGQISPVKYFELARQYGIETIAITEHHNIDSQIEIQLAKNDFPDIRIILAAELTVQTSVGNIDLLCYNLPIISSVTKDFRDLLLFYRQWQIDYGRAFCQAMQSIGYNYRNSDRASLLESYRPKKCLDLHLDSLVKNEIQTEYFIQQGYIRNKNEYAALRKSFTQKGLLPAYPDVEHVTQIIKSTGGLIVIAHPWKYFQEKNLKRMDLLREECHLDGIECAHPNISAELTPFYRQYCEKHSLLSTAGSDCHREEDATRKMGIHLGEDGWLSELLERL